MLHQPWDRFDVFQSLRNGIACSGDPTQRLADMKHVLDRGASSRYELGLSNRKLMWFQALGLFSLAIETLRDNPPDPCRSVRPPFLRQLAVDPLHQGTL